MPRTFAGAVFVLIVAALVTLPIWYPRLGASASGAPLALARPRGEACVEPADVMRRQHMRMLFEWRDSVVRGSEPNRRTHVNAAGVSFEKSLTRTCLGCHGSAQEFCNRCHERASVTINCFNCHIASRDGDTEASNVRR